jgi:ABC-type transport system involved in multi-copper enzyme maturation permease subunit
LTSLLTLMRMTLLELWRRRVSALPVLVLFFGVLIVFMRPAEITVNGQAVAVSAQGLAGLVYQVFQFFGAFLGLSVGSGLMAHEIERGTILLLATKPVPRWALVLGKGLGGFAFVAGWFVLWATGFSIAMVLHFPGVSAGALLLGGVSGLVTGWLFVAITLCFSTRLPAVGAMGAGVFAWFLGMLAPPLMGLEQVPGNEAVGHIARAIAWLIPTNALKGLPFALAFGPWPTALQLAPMAVVALWLLLAGAAFQTRSLN